MIPTRWLRYRHNLILLLLLALVAAGCVDAAPPAPPAASPVASPAATPSSTRGMVNTMQIESPRSSDRASGSVTVQGSGIAFENTMHVDVKAGDRLLGQALITTAADVGQRGYFTTTIELAPVTEETAATVTLYTTSAQDGSVDQSASVQIVVEPAAQPGTVTPAAGGPEIRLHPDHGPTGTNVVVVGEGFPAGAPAEVRLGGLNTGTTQEAQGRAEADGEGVVRLSFVVPDAWPNGEQIVSTDLVVMVSTPDFTSRASEVFHLETVGQLPTRSDSAREPGAAVEAFLLTWMRGSADEALLYLSEDLRTPIIKEGNARSGLGKLLGVQNRPASVSVAALVSQPERSLLRATLEFGTARTDVDFTLQRSGEEWQISEIVPVR